METQNILGNSLSEHRFRKVLFTLRLTGIPLNMRSVSTIRTIYNGIMAVCFFIAYSACVMNLIFNSNNLKDAMKTVRLLFGLQLDVWIYVFFRYLLFHCVIVSCVFNKRRVLYSTVTNL
jgi:hypothetical protein